MAKWYGTIGYVATINTAPGVWQEVALEAEYEGDMTRNHRRWNSGQEINDGITLQNELSIVCDPGSIPKTIVKTYPKDLIVDGKFIRFADEEVLSVPVSIEEVVNFQNIRYITYLGANWKVTSIDVQYPRLVLSIGGVYNGPQAGTAE